MLWFRDLLSQPSGAGGGDTGIDSADGIDYALCSVCDVFIPTLRGRGREDNKDQGQQYKEANNRVEEDSTRVEEE